MSQVPLDPRLQVLLDKREIEDLLLRYCRAVDRRDFALLATLYHPEAIDEHGEYFNGPASEFVARLPQIMAANRITSHNLCNRLIEVDGDYGEGEISTLAYHQIEAPEGLTDLMIGGRYLDRYTRYQGRWLIQHRRIVLDWSQSAVASFDATDPGHQATNLGTAGADDPSYDFFRLLRRG